MAEKRSRSLTRNKYLFLSLFIILLLIYGYLPLGVKLKKLNRLIKNIEQEIVSLKKENTLLEEEKKRLESDLNYVERMARGNLDLIRRGEILYKIVEKKSRGGAVR